LGFVIGNLSLDSKLVLAPLAGVSDSSFRLVCRAHGASLVYTEMVSADGVRRENKRTLELLAFLPEERPVGIQLFGSHPGVMAAAAARVMELSPDLIDLNFGCPARKVVGREAGSALLNNLALLRKIASAAVAAVDVPVTAKIRSGWDEKTVNADKVTAMLADCGVSAVTVHARSRADKFTGKADWDVIGRAKSAVGIPVIGNGDVTEPEDALRMLRETGCDAVMVGRGALGNPWIFNRASRLVETGEVVPPPTVRERLELLLAHMALVEGRSDRSLHSLYPMRKHVGWYTKGLSGAGALRKALGRTESWEDLRRLVVDFGASLGVSGLGESGGSWRGSSGLPGWGSGRPAGRGSEGLPGAGTEGASGNAD
jgi:nifR3 family TIM-barrel protein